MQKNVQRTWIFIHDKMKQIKEDLNRIVSKGDDLSTWKGNNILLDVIYAQDN